jgi:hypothetical protein
MTRRKIPEIQPGKIPWEERVLLAVDEYHTTLASKGDASFRALGRRYNVAWSTIRNRVIRGHKTRKQYAIARQRLTPGEELALEGWCKQLEK